MESIRLASDGRMRRGKMLICAMCGKEFWRSLHLIKTDDKTKYFCSQDCAHKAHSTVITLICAYCGRPFARGYCKQRNAKHGLYFCSRTCKDNAQRVESGFTQLHPPHYKDGNCNYRKIAYRHYDLKCANCGYKEEPRILQVHHIDHCRTNNTPNNLIILCPNCHRLETMGLAKLSNGGKLIATNNPPI